MQSFFNTITAWQQLKHQKISCEEALVLLVNKQGTVNLTLLDRDVSCRFLRHFCDKNALPKVIPLLLWRGCYYLVSPIRLLLELINEMRDRTRSEISVISISDQSYLAWFHSQNLNNNHLSAVPSVSPLTGQDYQEDISETTELNLSKSGDQIDRIKTLLSGALRNRASDIHLEPMPDDTNDAVGAIPRLKDIGPDPGLLSDALLGIVAQRLARRVCEHCAEPYTPTELDLQLLGLEMDQASASNWRKGKGCAVVFQFWLSGTRGDCGVAGY